jgi:pimeloyl-ACP methyl ester carboxylesterase
MCRLLASVVLTLFPATAPAGPPEAGVVFVIGGVGGVDPLTVSAAWALPRAGVPHEIRDFRWTYGTGHFLRDLQDARRLRQKAAELAGLVLDYRAAHPDRPVYLLGHSGGAGLAVATAEMLPPATLERVVLLSAAVSPCYDLTPALRATRGEIVSFYSDMDRLVLGWGTSQFGTVDRVYGPAAGRVGFTEPDGLDEEGRLAYRRLVQIPWRPELLLEANVGGHQATVRPDFLSRYVAPWLR